MQFMNACILACYRYEVTGTCTEGTNKKVGVFRLVWICSSYLICYYFVIFILFYLVIFSYPENPRRGATIVNSHSCLLDRPGFF